VSGVDLEQLFRAFQHTAFRLETRQTYDVSEEKASYEAFIQSRARPERSVRTDSYLRAVAWATMTGRQWDRVRLIEYPLTPYTRYELACYEQNATAGERVHVIDASVPLFTDFWLFDRGHASTQAVFMHYTPDGAFRGLEQVADRATLRALEIAAADLLTRATPLAEFLTRPAGV
jgi:hypothetical protein